MICHEHRIIFIHLPKCGGTSIEVALTGKSWNSPELRPEQHLTAEEARQRYGEHVFDSYFKFAVVRNTWDLLVAYYLWGASGLLGWIPPGLPWGREWGHPFGRRWRWLARRPSFAEYLNNPASFNKRLYFSWCGRDLTRQKEALSINGKLAVDSVVCLDNLHTEFRRITERTGLPPRELPHILKSRRTKHYSHFYDAALREHVRQMYADDIEAFGFIFEQRSGSRW